MKTEPAQPNYAARAAFTLTELVVTIAVLTVLVLLVTRLVDSATTIITSSGKGIDADAEARLIFDRLQVDFSRMLRRGDVDFFGKGSAAGGTMTGNDQIAFYSGVPGYYSSPSPTATPDRNSRYPASLVAYAVSADARGRPQLVRLAKGLVWEAAGGWQDLAHLPIQLTARWPTLFQTSPTTPPSDTGMADADYEVIGDSVVRFEYCYLLQPTSTAGATHSLVPYNAAATGHTTADFYRDVAAMVVAVTILDPKSRVIVNDYSQLTSQTLFPDATGMEIATPWVAAINRPTFAANARIPQAAASLVHTYQRRFSFAAPD